SLGGLWNAFSTEDVTGYANEVPRGAAGFFFCLAAGRVRNPLFFSQTGQGGREGGQRERQKRNDEKPLARAAPLLRQTAFYKHPYAHTAVGETKDLDTITAPDCKQFYDRFYQPQNATLVIVGDLAEADVRAQVEQAFGGIARGPAITRSQAKEPEQKEYAEK